MSDNDFDLDRFLDAQDVGGTYDAALAELRAGCKITHYLAHPVLGARLREPAAALLHHDDLGAEAILGPVDALKLRSSMTLFARAEPLFVEVLERFCGGEAHPATEERI